MSAFTGPGTSPRSVATAIGAGRVVLSTGLYLAPTASVRALGVDSASAKRMSFLVRMMAVRDAGIGIGTLLARDTPELPMWVAVGAAADAVDAVALAAATRRGVTRGFLAWGTSLGAAAIAGVGTWAALERVRGRD